MSKSYKTITESSGPLLIVEAVTDVKYEELVEVELADGSLKKGRVLEISDQKAVVQMFDSTTGLNLTSAKATFLGKTMEIGTTPELLGRICNGAGQPIDQAGPILATAKRDIAGYPINPFSRDFPNDFIQTGISAIDGLNTLVRGQKLPIFSGAGLPHAQLAAQIARQAKTLNQTESEKFAVVFGAMGITFDEAEYFKTEFSKTGALEHGTLFLNLADDPVVERITLPRIALTVAEYLAFDQGMHVLVILTDLTNYCEALREISAARKEIPGRRGYPGYLYTDLATLYERAGRLEGKPGSVTQIPILTMPEDDKTHPIPDLTGYITEGQIILSRELHNQTIYPNIDVLDSLSRLKDKGIGPDKTREDHAGLLNQLFATYAQGKEVRELAVILGESSLSELDKKYLHFTEEFETNFIQQGDQENRSIIETLDIGWKLLGKLPKSELKRIKKEHLEKYYPKVSVNEDKEEEKR